MNATHPLKKYRRSQSPRLTQGRLAKALRVSRTTVARWEIGARKIDPELVAIISAMTGIPKRELRPDLADLMKEAAE